jgi:hypothetical protein
MTARPPHPLTDAASRRGTGLPGPDFISTRKAEIADQLVALGMAEPPRADAERERAAAERALVQRLLREVRRDRLAPTGPRTHEHVPRPRPYHPRHSGRGA